MRSRTLAIVSLLACGLVLGGSLWVVRTVARRSEPGPYGGEEQAGPWYFLGDEDYQIVTLVDGRPVLFNELREVDMMTISDHVAELQRVEESQLRPDIVPPVRFYTVSERNQLIPVPRAVFSLAREGGSTVKLSRLTVSGKSILVAADPASGYSSTGVWSLPGGRFLLPGRETFWLVEPGQEVGRRVSATEYDGKTIGELREEFRALRGPDNPAGFHWYWNPILSPDGNNVAFVTDRDCLAGGDSVWVNHLPSGEEYPLIRNAAGADERYRIDGWVDDGHLFITRFLGPETTTYHLLALTGELTPLHLEGEHPGIARVGPRGMIAYRPDVVTHFPKDLYIARVDTA
ncbi:MAG: hypothetical protein RDU89_12100, partial [bacterium]|nr:hypothetical protein [bacterium]